MVAAVFCLVVTAGCSRAVEGTAVVDDAWNGQGVPQIPAAFDPCEFDEITLSVAAGVDPETKLTLPDGCGWSGDNVGFAAVIGSAFSMDTAANAPGVTELTEMDAGGRTVLVFVYKGDSCVTLTEVDGRVLQLNMIEKPFSPFCSTLRVTTRMLLDDI